MPKILSEEQVAGYHENGFVTPVPLFNADEVAACRADVENTEATMGEFFQALVRLNSICVFPGRLKWQRIPNCWMLSKTSSAPTS